LDSIQSEPSPNSIYKIFIHNRRVTNIINITISSTQVIIEVNKLFFVIFTL
jgi:hypothetical protein